MVILAERTAYERNISWKINMIKIEHGNKQIKKIYTRKYGITNKE